MSQFWKFASAMLPTGEEGMKRNCSVAIIFCFIIAFAAVSGAAHLQEGFMGYKWGENILAYNGLTKLHSKKDVTYYSNPGVSYTIDEISINNVVFGAYQNKLFAVFIGIDTLEKYDDINRYLKKKYGLPATKVLSKVNLTTYQWKYQDVTIKLKTDEIKGKMKLALYYTKLTRDLNEIGIEDLDTASYRFFPIDKNKKPEMIPFLEF